MIFITQLIYIKAGAESVFQQFEALAIPLIARHGGQLLLRINPGTSGVIANNIEVPYELHLVSFPCAEDLERFMQDPERKQLLHLKEQSVRAVLLIRGENQPAFELPQL